MIDIHAPHETVHTWRDFFIHIATIVVGLCIAVGLEQTVEFFHHRHQRHLSEQRILAQAERNRTLADSMEQWDDYSAQNSSILLQALQAAPVKDGRITFLAPVLRHNPDGVKPSMESWETAKADGSVSLFPPGVSEAIGRVFYELQQESMPYAALNANLDALQIFREQSQLDLTPGKSVSLSIVERDRLALLTATDAGLRKRDLQRWQYFAAANQSLLDGATSLEQLIAGARAHQQTYHPAK